MTCFTTSTTHAAQRLNTARSENNRTGCGKSGHDIVWGVWRGWGRQQKYIHDSSLGVEIWTLDFPECERNLRCYLGIYFETLRKAHKFSHESPCSSRHLNQVLPEWKSEVLPLSQLSDVEEYASGNRRKFKLLLGDLNLAGRKYWSGSWRNRIWIGFIWLMIEFNCRILWIQWWNFGFHKRRGISWPDEQLSRS
jgi:hypothetical protein